MHKCRNYKQLSPENIQCLTCAHYCKIKPGQVGICGIRQNQEGKLYLLTYGKAAAAQVDPIEKKPFFHFLPGSTAYSFGTLGCNFRCANCQNCDISQMFDAKGNVGQFKKIHWGQSLSPEQIVEAALNTKCQSIAYTYNEPTVFLEYAIDTMKLAKQKGLKNVWVSNGFMSPETVDLILPYLDAINIDIKSFDDAFYQTNCGARLQPVLDNCKRFVEAGVWLEITTLIIPTLSDDKRMLRQLAKFIKRELAGFVPWHLSAFSGEISWKLQNLSETDPALIAEAYRLGKDEGLKYVYAGNLWDVSLSSTHCVKCRRLIIQREGYAVQRFDDAGLCKHCGREIEGVF